jgi:cache 3/cache 2 fusion protein
LPPTPDARLTGGVVDDNRHQERRVVSLNQEEAVFSTYVTGYEPIKDGSGNVMGIYYVGYKK